MSDKRKAQRVKRRLGCILHHMGKRYSGLVLDISASGLFVQTGATPDPGDPLDLELSLPGAELPLELQGQAARRRVVPPRLRSFAHGGVGVRLWNPPEPYYQFVAKLLHQDLPAREAEPERRKPTSLEKRARKLALRRALGPCPPQEDSKAAEAPSEEPRKIAYRVKVKQGPRFQTLDVMAESEKEARELALKEAGAGWRALRCEPA